MDVDAAWMLRRDLLNDDDWWINMTRTPSPLDRRKGPAALLGLSALVAMGVIGAVAGGASDGQTAVVSVGSMSTGETTTLTFSGTVEPVKNVPPVKATPYKG